MTLGGLKPPVGNSENFEKYQIGPDFQALFPTGGLSPPIDSFILSSLSHEKLWLNANPLNDFTREHPTYVIPR
jgi:hypothetical protein